METALSVPGTSPLGPRFARQTAGGGGTFWGQTYYFASWFPLSKLEITYRGETFLYVAVQYVRPLNVPRPSLSYGLTTLPTFPTSCVAAFGHVFNLSPTRERGPQL